MSRVLSYAFALPKDCDAVIAPGGLATPHGSCTGVEIVGGTPRQITEQGTGQTAVLIAPGGDDLTLTYHFDDSIAAYPDEMFQIRDTRYTRYADALAEEALEAAEDRVGLDRARAIACATAERFTYGHTERRFNDGHAAVPAIGCGLTEGSCVDINTYFIAALRAAGLEAGYVTGYFIPEEKGDWCEDGHCWVVTRINGETQEWDIAHHLKMGTRDIQPGLNPKPGLRVACFHSMGLNFPDPGVRDLKALIEPMAIKGGTAHALEGASIRLRHRVGS